MICVSCNNEHSEKFCPNCGEKNGVQKITIRSIIEDSVSFVTDMDRGFLFNFKTLIFEPQKIATDYILGKRKGIFNPISYLIFSVSIYLVVERLLRVPLEPTDMKDLPKSILSKASYEAGFFIREHIKYFWILSILPFGLSLKLVFRKYTYLEHLAISSFIIGQATLIAIISFIFFRTPLILDPIVYLAMAWLTHRIFKNPNARLESFLLSITAMVLFLIQLILIVIIIVIFKT